MALYGWVVVLAWVQRGTGATTVSAVSDSVFDAKKTD